MSQPQPNIMDILRGIDVTEGKSKLRQWLNMNFKIEMTDGRILIGVFLCTDRDANVILACKQCPCGHAQCFTTSLPTLSACSEYLRNNEGKLEESPRILGLVMVPGRHIVSIQLDDLTHKYYEE